MSVKVFFYCAILLFFTGLVRAEPTNSLKPLLVTLNLNGRVHEAVYRCYKDKDSKIWFAVEDLKILHFPQKATPPLIINQKEYLLLDGYEGIEYQIDEQSLVLTLLTPMSWNNNQPSVTQIDLENKGFRPEHPGVFLNYDVTGRYQGFNTQTNTAAFTELGLFNHYGVGTSGFLFNGYSYFTQQNSIARLDTTWTVDEPEHMASWRIGDSISSGLNWNGAVRFAGLQYATNFNTQPSLITFPQPAIRGEAVLPSSIDILVNGTQAYQAEVERGPFYLTQVPFITGAGNIQVVTTDMLGRQQVSSFSYYASPALLKAGLSDYSFEIGSIRHRYGFESNHYDQALGVGTYSLGLTDHYTAGIHAEMLKEQQTVGLANDYLLGSLGIISLGGALSHANGKSAFIGCSTEKRGTGALVNLGFRRQTDFLSFGVQSTIASNDYIQIGTFRDKGYPNLTLQSFIGLSTENIGSFSFTYTNLNNAFNRIKIAPYEYFSPNAEVLMLSYSKNLFGNFFFTVSGLSDLKRANNKQIFASLIIPFDDGNKSVSLNEFSQNRQHQENIQLVKNLPLGNGYGYRLAAANNSSVPLLSEVNLQNNQGAFGARYFRAVGTHNAELNARGSLIHFAEHTFLARYVDQSFALVQVPGFENIDVYYRNQPIGKTNKKGYLYIPYLLAYQRNEINLDPNKLPMDLQIKEINKIVVPYDRSGVFVKFDASIVENVLLTLRKENEEFIPAGADVYLDSSPESSLPVGYNGQVFISMQKTDSLSGYAQWDNQICHFKLKVQESTKAIKQEQAICY